MVHEAWYMKTLWNENTILSEETINHGIPESIKDAPGVNLAANPDESKLDPRSDDEDT